MLRDMKRTQARRWSRVAFGAAILFFLMAIGGKIVTGDWPFDGSLELSVMCIAVGVVFRVLGMRRFAPLPDPSALLNQAFTVASSGRIDEAIAILNKAIQQNPQLWQALQYRGELYLALQNNTAAARDFAEAIRLAPDERHLHHLHERATSPAGAALDCETTPGIRDSEAR
jgi:tetratricopeptide (TPR) repeat protein